MSVALKPRQNYLSTASVFGGTRFLGPEPSARLDRAATVRQSENEVAEVTPDSDGALGFLDTNPPRPPTEIERAGKSHKSGGRGQKKGSATGSGSKPTASLEAVSDDFADEFGGAVPEFEPGVEVLDLYVPAIQDGQNLKIPA